MMISLICRFLFILIICCLKNQVFSSPVLLWSNVNLPQSAVPHSTLSSLNLISNYICKLTNEQIYLRLVAVNDLTIEDIQHGPQYNHPLLLEARKDKTNFRFYPNVNNDIYKTLSLLPQSNNMKCSHIQFKIKSSKIYETLTDALDIMQTTIAHNVETHTNKVVIIALVNNPSDIETLTRRRRQAISNATNILISNNQTCMFYAQQLTWNNVNGSKTTGQNYTLNYGASSCQPNLVNPNQNFSSIILNLIWTNLNQPFDILNMSLITTIIGRYWYLENATINANEYRYFAYGMHDQMVTPPTFSYVCGNAIFVRFDNAILHGKYNFTDKFFITNLQFQPFNGSGLSFGAPNYCTSFFTSGIWMGIVTSLLCLGILFFGIYRMMAIKSNDRFDDPKGKPLIIKAHE